jgi:hypothetical protein
MKVALTLFGIFCLVLTSNPAFAQDDEAAMMAAWDAAKAVGPEHAFLKQMEGNWTYIVTNIMSPEETETTHGKSTKTMTLGGRYLEDRSNGTSMNLPFEGHNLICYDNILKKFRICWTDNFGTGFMLGDGVRETDALTFVCTYPSLTGGPDDKYKLVYNISNDNKHMMTMYLIAPDGQELKQMEVVYTRVK